MTGSAKRKGDSAELEAAALLSDLLGFPVKRALGAGRAEDTGDLFGIPQTVVQVANWANPLAAIRAKPIDAETQRENANATFVASMVRLRGGMWRVILTPEQFATLLREALADQRTTP